MLHSFIPGGQNMGSSVKVENVDAIPENHSQAQKSQPPVSQDKSLKSLLVEDHLNLPSERRSKHNSVPSESQKQQSSELRNVSNAAHLAEESKVMYSENQSKGQYSERALSIEQQTQERQHERGTDLEEAKKRQ